MTKKEMEQRLHELNKTKVFTDEIMREVAYLERQLERINSNEQSI
jgi:hypothetical protein